MSTTIHHRLTALGWTEDREAHFREHARAGRYPARVVGAARGSIRARSATGDISVLIQRGHRRRAATGGASPVVGDWLALEPVDDDRGALRDVLPRTSRFARGDQFAQHAPGGFHAPEQVLAANVDTVIIVAALTRELNPRRLERYLTLAWASGADPLLLLNKSDLCDDLDGCLAQVLPVAGGVPVLTASAVRGEGLDAIGPWLQPGRTVILLGSSGVGKSTITNALLESDRQSVREVREDDSRGRHTTTARELFELPGGALLVDTPGMRSLELVDDDQGLDVAFADIEELAVGCRFGDCSHEVEPGCAVMAAIERGQLPADRLRARRKLHRELGLVSQAADAAARRANARVWGRMGREASEAAERKRAGW